MLVGTRQVDWEVHTAPCSYWAGGKQYQDPKLRVTYRSDTHERLGVFTGRYTPLKNSTFLGIVQEMNPEAVLEEYDGGRTVMSYIPVNPEGELEGGVVVVNGHSGNRAPRARFMARRPACANVFNAYYPADFRISHSQDDIETFGLQLREWIIDKAPEFIAEVGLVERMRGFDTDYRSVFQKVSALIVKDRKDPEEAQKVVYNHLLEAYVRDDQPQEGGTAWVAMNAVTAYTTHKMGRTQDQRNRAIFSGLTNRIQLNAIQAIRQFAL